MKYKNISKGVLKFRVHAKDGQKRIFELKPDEEMESDRLVSLGGLELVNEEPKLKKTKEEDK